MGTMNRTTPNRSVRVPDQEWAEAQAIAAWRGESVGLVIRNALRDYIARNANAHRTATTQPAQDHP